MTHVNKDSCNFLCSPFFFTSSFFFLGSVPGLFFSTSSFISFSLIFNGLSFNVFDLLVEEQINHNIPFFLLAEFSSEDQDFSSKEPEDHGDGFGVSVVAGDGNIDEREGRVSIGKADSGDVDVGSFNDGLSIALGVNNNQKLGFSELFGVLIGEGTGGPSGGRVGGGTSVLSILDDGSLTVGSGADNDDFFGSVDGGDDSSGELDLLPGLFEVDDVDTFGVFMVNISAHFVVKVQGTEVSVASE